jgi:hypothetical protein
VGVKWAQGSSQHDKCQVGNMHTYSLELVHFPRNLSSFLHSLNYHPYPVVIVHVPVPGKIWSGRGGLSSSWTIEETSCQTLEHSLQVRELLGISSQGAKLQLQGSETSCLACC